MLFVTFRASIKNITQKYSKRQGNWNHTLESISLTTSATTTIKKCTSIEKEGLDEKKCWTNIGHKSYMNYILSKNYKINITFSIKRLNIHLKTGISEWIKNKKHDPNIQNGSYK